MKINWPLAVAILVSWLGFLAVLAYAMYRAVKWVIA